MLNNDNEQISDILSYFSANIHDDPKQIIINFNSKKIVISKTIGTSIGKDVHLLLSLWKEYNLEIKKKTVAELEDINGFVVTKSNIDKLRIFDKEKAANKTHGGIRYGTECGKGSNIKALFTEISERIKDMPELNKTAAENCKTIRKYFKKKGKLNMIHEDMIKQTEKKEKVKVEEFDFKNATNDDCIAFKGQVTALKKFAADKYGKEFLRDKNTKKVLKLDALCAKIIREMKK